MNVKELREKSRSSSNVVVTSCVRRRIKRQFFIKKVLDRFDFITYNHHMINTSL